MNLIKAAATVSGLTLLSRITGLIRENITAVLYGAGAMTDAFFVAFRLPNLLRRMFAEGAFSQAFVPLIGQAKHRAEQAGDRDGGRLAIESMVDHTGTALFWVLILISALGVAAAPILVYLMASGLSRDPSAYEASILMTRWMFPYIFFMGMVALSAGILNTWKKVAIPAFTPVLLNLSFIGSALLLRDGFSNPIYALAAGVVIGGVLQMALQIPALLQLKLLPRISFNLRAAFADPDTLKIIKQMLPALLAVSVSQLSLVLNTQIASRLAAGSVSWITFGDRLMEFPTAMLGVALGTVLLPSLSRAAAAKDSAQYSQLLDWGLRLVFLLAVPATIGLALMAEPLTAMLFHYGKFTAYDVQMTRLAVLGYSVGLLGLIAIKVLAPAFFARQDVRTPLKIGVAVLLVTQLMNLLLVPIFKHAGLTLSISIGALINALWLYIGLRRAKVYLPSPGWLTYMAKLLIAGALMAGFVFFASAQFQWVAMNTQPLIRITAALGIVCLAGALYAASLTAMGIRPREFMRKST